MTAEQHFIPFHLPSIGEEEIAEVVDTLRSGWLTTGPKTKRFEAEFAERIGAAHAIAVNSGTAALHVALAAIDLEAGDEVIIPTNTFTASAEVVTYFGAKPVFVDIRRDTFNLDETLIEQAITERTRAIMPVHMAGQACEMMPIREIARRHDLVVVEDAAHALPATYRGETVGSGEGIAAFSFYATKTITTGEGGMVTTADAALAERIRMLTLHGISKDAWKRYTAEGSWYYEVVDAGFKYNMPDLAASIGIHQLAKAESLRSGRERVANAYSASFASEPGLLVPEVLPHIGHAWHLYVLRVEIDELTIDRAQFIEELRDRGIGASVHFIPLHLQPYYQQTFGYRGGVTSRTPSGCTSAASRSRSTRR